MDSLKIEKAAIDSDPNLSPWEKLARKLMANEQIADLIDREAECRCDWVDFGYECMRHVIRNTSCSWQEEQQRLHCLHDGAEAIKFQIWQQAEYAKRQRDEQERVRWILSTAAPRQPMFYSCANRFP
ncbi:MAG: hypothetical protein IJB33_06695 [Akkermansia sp.]|nr:hypothetical protein [Akkermansia sp.]